eukprot:TRINITY_DN1596_c0_g2_i1.p1 TRINITY_DN1596_c0_g2~~TRINITY_DN1596_c0_g2_i1.p1  ORF type:complete len:301 (+),score=61.62 TRINITY_DN1596_c0_g2_i1:2-904(+)
MGAAGGDAELSLDAEVARLLNGKDHYMVLGLARFEEFDEGILKREYRKKALLVHPDKNVGNSKCEEAFKVLQNAYEVLKDPEKKKEYDGTLQLQEVEEQLRQRASRARQQAMSKDVPPDDERWASPDAKRIFCSRCCNSHLWAPTSRSKTHARYCKDCRSYHSAKDGDGWMEQTGKWVFFNLIFKADLPKSYACSDGKIYDVSEWVECQGLKCEVNTHRPTFKVSTNQPKSGPGQSRNGRSGKGSAGSAGGMPDLDNMTEEEFFEWLARVAGGEEVGRGGDPRGGTPGKKQKRKMKKKNW